MLDVGYEIDVKTLVFGVGRTQIMFSILSIETRVLGKIFFFYVLI